VLEWCGELSIPAVTLWAISTDNLSRRSAAEVSGILAAVEAKVAALARDPRIHQRRVRVKAAGRLEMLPASTVAAIRAAEEATAGYNDGLALTIAVAYGGHDEIIDAVRALLREAADEGKALADAIEAVTPASIARHLYMAGLPDPDLIIRTSGENRLSGFLLWQSAYSELYFTDIKARVPQDRLPARGPRISAAPASIWRLIPKLGRPGFMLHAPHPDVGRPDHHGQR
jgi:short-chain Z-isoprenyl diphosphate synthase